MSLLGFCQWLEGTRGSIAIHESLWGYPTVSTAHVIALSVFVGTIAVVDFRLLGITMRRVPVSEIVSRLLPWALAGFGVMVLSGILLFYADPVRYYPNIFLRLKLVLLIASGLNALVFHRSVYRNIAQWDLHPVAPRGARVAGTVSLVFLAVIIVSGRMIAYYDEWFDCDRHPRSAIVNVVAGCTDSP